jgi:hypothetical protein
MVTGIATLVIISTFAVGTAFAGRGAVSAAGDSAGAPAPSAAPPPSSSTWDYAYDAVRYAQPVVDCWECGKTAAAVGTTLWRPELAPLTIPPIIHSGDPSGPLRACAGCATAIYNALPSSPPWHPQPLYGPVPPYTPPLAPFPTLQMTPGYDYPVGTPGYGYPAQVRASGYGSPVGGTSLPHSFFGN